MEVTIGILSGAVEVESWNNLDSVCSILFTLVATLIRPYTLISGSKIGCHKLREFSFLVFSSRLGCMNGNLGSVWSG